MIEKISVNELRRKEGQEGSDHILLDVRQPEEHISYNIGGVLIPVGELAFRVKELSDHKSKEIIVYCRSGVRSATACYLLKANGFKNVKNLTGGMIEWAKEMEGK